MALSSCKTAMAIIAMLLLLLIPLGIIGNNPSDNFISEDVSIRNDTITLYGTLLKPTHVKNPPIILFISGSGPTDRNGNQFGMVNNSIKLLAEELAIRGVASVRYDKRGVGQSICNQEEIDVVFDNFADDAAAWLKMLNNNPNFSRVFVAGHSEGSLVGMLAINQISTDGFISIAGAGKRIDRIILEQISSLPDSLLNESKSILDSLLIGRTVNNVPMQLFGLFRPSVQPYMISWLRYDPTEVLSKINIPQLIVQGTTDIQVPVENAKLLAVSNENANLEIIEGMNHVLKMAEADRMENIATYRNPSLPVSNKLVETIAKFVKSHE
ncbi:MAG: alpha/beta hydrolase family protein [Bacteroidales bacterium]